MAMLSAAEEEPVYIRHLTRAGAARPEGVAGVEPNATPVVPPSTLAPTTSSRATSAHETMKLEAAGLGERDSEVEPAEALLEVLMAVLRNAAAPCVLLAERLVLLVGFRPVQSRRFLYV